VEDARRLSIGQVARLAGVTPKTLRHYDRLGVLRPADVDPDTGYRWYVPAQVEQVRLVRRLRALELPLEDVRRLLDLVGDRDAFRSALAEHRRRIDARVTRLRGILHTIDHALTDEEWTMSAPAEPDVLEPEVHRRLGADLFNDTWRLMELEDRSPADDVLMIHQAHASAYHWLQVGTPQNVARSHWLCSRDHDEAARHIAQARLASADITTDEDRELLLSDLETIPSAG
jgi:DNA-binding transcriptional MerR regulator